MYALHCPPPSLLLSCQYEQAADAELAWVAETRRKLLALGPVCLEQDQTTAQLQVQKVRFTLINHIYVQYFKPCAVYIVLFYKVMIVVIKIIMLAFLYSS